MPLQVLLLSACQNDSCILIKDDQRFHDVGIIEDIWNFECVGTPMTHIKQNLANSPNGLTIKNPSDFLIKKKKHQQKF